MATDGMFLGLVPEPLKVNLTTGADFLCTLQLDDDWPVGTVLSLVHEDGTEWDATISTTDATFSEDKAVADLIAQGSTVTLRYVNGTTDQIWAIGTVKRHG